MANTFGVEAGIDGCAEVLSTRKANAMERGKPGAKQNKEMAPKLHRGPDLGPPILDLYGCCDNRRPSLWPRYVNVDRSPASRAKRGLPTRV